MATRQGATLADDSSSVRRLTERTLQIRRLRVLGTTLRVAVWPGNQDRLPLLLFNGIGASIELLAPFADAIDDIEVVAFDVPGTGESGPPPIPYRLWMLALMGDRLLDELGYDRIDVLGVSWGGAVAQQFALQNPRRCRRLVLAATCAGVTMVPPRLSVLTKFMTPRRYNDAAYRHAIAEEIYGGDIASRPEILEHFGRTRQIGYLLQQAAVAGWSSLPWLWLVRQPTLILAGDDDRIVPVANARVLAFALHDSRTEIMHDGHLFLISRPDQSAALVSDFLSS